MENIKDTNRELCADLHSHTTRSDGVLSPAALVDRAGRNGVELLAITDHDSTAGLAEAQVAAGLAGLTLVPGVEISVSWSGTVIHVLGLGIDADCPVLVAGLDALSGVRVERAARLAHRLDKAGITGSLEGASAYAAPGVPGRNHFARFLVEGGHAKDTRRAFRRYLAQGASCYVPCEWAGLDEALAWIAAAGGQGVLAHPGRYRLSRTALRRLLQAFRDGGGAAIEVISGAQTPDLTTTMAGYAREYGLLASRGSDFHVPGGGIDLGHLPPLPANCTPLWRAWQGAPCNT